MTLSFLVSIKIPDTDTWERDFREADGWSIEDRGNGRVALMHPEFRGRIVAFEAVGCPYVMTDRGKGGGKKAR